MILLTPPSTVLRVLADKENIPDNVDNVSGGSRVVWSQKNSYHSPTKSTSSSSVPLSSTTLSRHIPTKSILKTHVQSPIFLLPFPAEPEPRDVTPEPADPLVDLNYLVYPVSQIIKHASDVSMRELIEAYNVLTARLRASVAGKTDLDATWPLFRPLRQHKSAFVDAVVRDLDRALINPASEAGIENIPRVSLPSPQSTPKKKGGMTGDQVKYARDLCTTCHSVIRFLGLIFTIPALRSIFTDIELRSILTALLAIPLAEELPTPNARKTCALAIWLLQCQRLPAAVLRPAKDRIAFALQRGIDGELGKEGKKGSTSDGLKAIHDLSVFQPAIFVPTFATTLLPSVLSSLLAPTLGLRTQACHALGGFVMGLLSLPRSKLHTRVSQTVAAFLTVPPPRKSPSASTSKSKLVPSKATAASTSSPSPVKPVSSPIPIINTLRTTLQAAEPDHVAAGPVWGLSVLAYLVVMLSSALTHDAKIARIVSTLLAHALKHPRSSVRAVGCLMWRSVIWVYHQDKLPPLDDSEGESEVDDDVKNAETAASKTKEAWWKVVTTVVELKTGLCTMAALLNSSLNNEKEDSDVDTDDALQRTLEVLHRMVGKPNLHGDALVALKHLLGISSSNAFEEAELNQDQDLEQGQWDPTTKILPHSLFSSLSGLLSVEFTALFSVVRPIFDETAGLEDLRALTKGEVTRGCSEPDSDLDLDSVGDHLGERKTTWDAKGSWWMWEGLVCAWRGCVLGLWEGDCEGTTVVGKEGAKEREREKEDIVSVWEALIGIGVEFLQDAGDDEATSIFAVRVVNVLTKILQNSPLELPVPRSSPPTPEGKHNQRSSSPTLVIAPKHTSTSAAPSPYTTLSCAAQLALIQRLWHAACRLIPDLLLSSSGAPERLLACLMKHEDNLTSPVFSLPSVEEDKEVAHLMESWTALCVDVIVKCNPGALRAFWGYVNSDGVREWDWQWDAKERMMVWGWFVARWMGASQNSENGGIWESAVVLLGVPFLDKNAWEMDEAGLRRWNELLQYATAHALDEGHDEDHAHVLSALATSIASHNQALFFSTSSSPSCNSNNSAIKSTAVSSPPTRLADLLLTTLASSFESRSCTQLPQSVLEFVNDAMRESYPPRPRDSVVFLWTARSVTRVVETCPRELIKCLLGGEGGIGEGVGIWITDECKAWSIAQLGYDIIPLYQTILTRILELPLALSTLRTFASVIASPFGSRADMPSAAKDAFREFWEATYARTRKPREGWPEEVEVCLRAVFGDVGDKAAKKAVIDPSLLTLKSTPTSATSTIQKATPYKCDSPANTTKAKSGTTSTSITPTSTTAAKIKKCTPPRPHKVNFHTKFPLRSPESPMPSLVPAAFSPPSFPSAIPFPAIMAPSSPEVSSPSTIRARTPSPSPSTPRKAQMRLNSMRPNVFKSMHVPTPATPKHSPGHASPTKRRRIGDREDKENDSPTRLFSKSSPTAKLHEEIEWVVKPFTLGKRARKENREWEGMSPQKKSRVKTRDPGDSEDERIVETLVITSSPVLTKRRRLFMDSVSVPRLQDVYPQLRSTSSLKSLRELCTPCSSPSLSHHKGQTRSVPKTLISSSGGFSRKRRRANTEDVFSVSKTSSTLDDSETESEPEVPFSDSFTLDRRPVSPKEPLSSDDDPHIGQVTPHRLISPIPRRNMSAKFYDVDPPSDDSVMGECASPSKEVVERRLKRLGSMTNIMMAPHSMLAKRKTPSGV